MGEIADMMLDGTLCEGCGVYLGGTEFDVPLLCNVCARDRRSAGHTVQRLGKHWQDWLPKVVPPARQAAPPAPKAKCPTCGKVVKVAGLPDHTRAVHGG